MQIFSDFGSWDARKRLYPLHPHRNDGVELVLITRGEVRWSHGETSVLQPANTFTFTWPWEEHGAADPIIPSARLSWIVFPLAGAAPARRGPVRLHRDLGFTAREQQVLMRRLRRGERRAVPASRRGCDLMADLQVAVKSEDPLATVASTRLGALLLLELANAAGTAPPEARRPSGRERAEAFVASLGDRTDESWTLEAMAAEAELGRTQFSRHIAELTGDTPLRLLNRLRIKQAQLALGDGDASVTEIAYALGFESSQYFSAVFRDFTGVSPTEWRRMRP